MQHIDSHYNFSPLPVNDLHFWNMHKVNTYLVDEESITDTGSLLVYTVQYVVFFFFLNLLCDG